MYIFIANFTFM